MSHAATIHVGKTHAFKSIHSAIAKANAGDTILVHSGLYQEGNINIDKRLTLIGIDHPV
ncbi:nitrous oxide reductase family maturation protein NosD, partial [Parapusillimonas sp. SGNA-6]|nr:nitrous oxide reductase family maturation protein NosD [Parapusillimonas sp. SGNA-6]